MDSREIRKVWERNGSKQQPFMMACYLTGNKREILEALERICVFRDTNYGVFSELRDAIQKEFNFTWWSDTERFIRDQLVPNLGYWVERWLVESSGRFPVPTPMPERRPHSTDELIVDALINLGRILSR